MFGDFTKVGYCAICGRKVKSETMCKFCADYESRIAKLKDENVILEQLVAQLEEQCGRLIEKRDALTIHKDKELAIYKKALELAVKRVNKTMEEPNPAIEMFVNLAKAEVENDKYGTRKED